LLLHLWKGLNGEDGKTKVAIIGSGNIGTDLMIKIMRLSKRAGNGRAGRHRPDSDGLKRAARMGVPITAEGIDGLVAMPEFADIGSCSTRPRRARTSATRTVLQRMASGGRPHPGGDRALTRSRRSTAMRTSMRPTSTW
jgi:hypothetical protein